MTNIRLYFDRKYIRIINGKCTLDVEHVESPSDTAGCHSCIGDDLRVFEDNGDFYVSHSDIDTPLNPLLNINTLRGITIQEHIPTVPHRINGNYVLTDHPHVTATVTTEKRHGQNESFKISVKSTKPHMDGPRELLLLIKTGKIEPVESFEDAQDGVTKADLEVKIGQLEEEIDELTITISTTAGNLKHVIRTMKDRGWWRSTRWVRGTLTSIRDKIKHIRLPKEKRDRTTL
jgi:hypothetical protein